MNLHKHHLYYLRKRRNPSKKEKQIDEQECNLSEKSKKKDSKDLDDEILDLPDYKQKERTVKKVDNQNTATEISHKKSSKSIYSQEDNNWDNIQTEKLNRDASQQKIHNNLADFTTSNESVDNKTEEVSLFVGNLSYETEESDFETFLNDNSIIHTNIRIIKDLSTGRSKGFGYFDVPSRNEAKKFENLINFMLNGREIRIGQANRRETSSVKSKTLILRNLAYSADSESLNNYLNDYEIKDIRVVFDKFTNNSKGYAYIEFYDSETAEKV